MTAYDDVWTAFIHTGVRLFSLKRIRETRVGQAAYVFTFSPVNSRLVSHQKVVVAISTALDYRGFEDVLERGSILLKFS